jgi:transcriptional regulator with XRE-family HTH domain
MSRKSKNNPNQHLANLIHATARIRGCTLADIAAHLGISYIYMASLSSGARKISGLSIDKQRALAKFLGISMVEFFLMCGLLRQEDLIIN